MKNTDPLQNSPAGRVRLSVDTLMAEATRQTALKDFGPPRFLEPLGVLVNAINREAQLSARGAATQSARLVNALVNRLRKQDILHRHPEILSERVDVAMAIVGLPRTGSTMLHRMLAASPQLTATRWWETIYPLPLPEEGRGENTRRRAMAETLCKQITDAAAGFESIHPMDANAHDEELTLIEQTFVSNMPESMMYVPSYGRYLGQIDPRWAYEELVTYIKILQWHSGGRAACKWVFKSPTHLQFMPTILEMFPKAVIVMTHRDITQLMGSWFSMTESLRRSDSDADVCRLQAAHWANRWRDSLATMMRARQGAENRFIDLNYRDLLIEPIESARRVFRKAELHFGVDDENAFRHWLASNPRDGRPSHKYALEDFGMTPKELGEMFSSYDPAT